MSGDEQATAPEEAVLHGSSPPLATTAQFVAELRWVSERLFELLGQRAPEALEPEVSVALATQARHHAEHVLALDELLPTVTELRSQSQALSDGRYRAAVEVLRSAGDSAELLGMLHGNLSIPAHGLLPHLLTVLEDALLELSPVADGPLIRRCEVILVELESDQQLGLQLADSLALSESDRQRAEQGRRALADSLGPATAGLISSAQ